MLAPLEQTEIMVLSSDGVTLPPAPVPTPTPAPIDTTPTGELQTVGPLPLASTSVATRDNTKVRPTHALKVGLWWPGSVLLSLFLWLDDRVPQYWTGDVCVQTPMGRKRKPGG